MTSGNLRDASELLQHAVAETLDALDLTDADSAAAKLAMDYAAQIDAARGEDPKILAWAMRWIAPHLLECLDALGATPLARSKLKTKGAPGDGKPNQLEQLRNARRR